MSYVKVEIDLDDIDDFDLINEVIDRCRYDKDFKKELEKSFKEDIEEYEQPNEKWMQKINDYLKDKCWNLAGVFEVEEKLGIS